MIVRKIEDLRENLAPRQRLIGIDHGTKTLGMAVSDSSLTIASPIGTIRRTTFTRDAEALFRAADERDVGGFVLGLPINMDGSEGPRCDAVREFARILLRVRDMPLAFWDERWSSAAVESAMITAGRSRRKRAKSIDTAAASYILQGALDMLSRPAPDPSFLGSRDGEA